MVGQEFWDDQHESNSRYWLTDTSPIRVLNLHKVESPKGKTVLDIGVGMGKFTKHLHVAGNRMIACDISQMALDRISDIAETYTTGELLSAPPADLAVCHLVMQHCDDSMVSQILNSVQLADDGLFSFQFAELISGGNERLVDHIENGRLYFRSIDRMCDFIADSPLKLANGWKAESHHWEGADIDWHIVHLRKILGG